MSVEFLSGGDTALTVQFGLEVNRALNARVIRVRRAIDDASLPGVIETVPTYRSLIVHYDPRLTSQDQVIRGIEPLLAVEPESERTGTMWRIPICYEPPHGWDLDSIARTVGMTPERLIEVHTSVTYYVYMVGFQPGQPHMGDLPEEMCLPRRLEPRLRLEQGAVVVGPGQTVIHSFSSPGGWHVIGRTPAPMFDIRANNPVLLCAGDSAVLVPITVREFDDIEEQVAAGVYRMENQEN